MIISSLIWIKYQRKYFMDALELQKRLTETGMSDELSRELIRFIEHRPDLATKRDLSDLASKEGLHKAQLDLTKEIGSFKDDMHKEFRNQMRWLLPLLFGQIGLLITMAFKVFMS